MLVSEVLERLGKFVSKVGQVVFRGGARCLQRWGKFVS